MMNFTQGELDVIKGVLGTGLTSLLAFLSHNVFVKSKVAKAEGLLGKIKGEIELHKTLATEAVFFAEQAFKDLGGARKLDAAKTWFTKEILAKTGVNLDDTIVQGYIESALKQAKLKVGEEWNSIPVPAGVRPVQTVQNVEPQSQATVTVTHVQPVE